MNDIELVKELRGMGVRDDGKAETLLKALRGKGSNLEKFAAGLVYMAVPAEQVRVWMRKRGFIGDSLEPN